MVLTPTSFKVGHRGFFAVVAALFLLVATACSSAPGVENAAAVEYSAVDAQTGEPVSMEDLLGRPAIVSSWATWCAPCRRELPALEQLHRGQPVDGLQVVIVNLDSSTRDKAVIQEMVDQLELTMPQWRDGDDNFTQIFKGFGVPMSILVDASGEVVHTWHGAINPQSNAVRSILEKVL